MSNELPCIIPMRMHASTGRMGAPACAKYAKSPRAAIFSIFTSPAKVASDQAIAIGTTTGVEYYLTQKAKFTGKSHKFLDPELWEAIDALSPTETCDLAIGLASMRVEVDFETKNGLNLMTTQRDLWNTGDSEELAKTIFSWPEDFSNEHSNAEKKWLELRNRIMTKKILILADNQISPVFVAIGAGHLSGVRGVISQLRKAGFILNPM